MLISWSRDLFLGTTIRMPLHLADSFAWWDWKRWEKEIDWMALQGINLPLAFTGQETIWQKVFQKFNVSKTDLDDFFGGPAFLAWSRMGNLHGAPTNLVRPTADSVEENSIENVFTWNDPSPSSLFWQHSRRLKYICPSAKIARLGNWFSVKSDLKRCCTYLLDATDPLFIEFGRAFIEQQLKECGRTSHIYNCDTFDENIPPVDDPEYISSLGATIFRGMQSGDNDAVWLMQALLHSVPVGKLVVLDLFAEVKPLWITSQQFYGVPYIWCMLHNFAGNVEMYGILDAIASGPVDALKSENSTMYFAHAHASIPRRDILTCYDWWLVLECQWKVSNRILWFMTLCLTWHFNTTKLMSSHGFTYIQLDTMTNQFL